MSSKLIFIGIFSKYANKIEFVIVLDITASNTFSNVLDSINYILYLVSLITGSIKKEEIFPLALKGTLSILRSAKEVRSIKKVVIISLSLVLEPLDKKEKPGFELFIIHPSFEMEGLFNGLLFGSIISGAFKDVALFSIYVSDIADIHIKCLDNSVTKGTKYFIKILEKDYPGVPHKLDKDSKPGLKNADTARVERELSIK
ncbi:hypothetical protein BKA61DRAFT_632402 [Leptodontidium sp. MPI-SDFR-AT-0119]|nr:hypothetical protein BKA61DRAFT_632402 [Leptodontidium sp. MPI-SDFR-AT-0119]